jgi:hypothetical protein
MKLTEEHLNLLEEITKSLGRDYNSWLKSLKDKELDDLDATSRYFINFLLFVQSYLAGAKFMIEGMQKCAQVMTKINLPKFIADTPAIAIVAGIIALQATAVATTLIGAFFTFVGAAVLVPVCFYQAGIEWLEAEESELKVLSLKTNLESVLGNLKLLEASEKSAATEGTKTTEVNQDLKTQIDRARAEIKALETDIKLAKVETLQHKMNARSYAACGTIMMGLAIVAALGATGVLSAGIVPFAVILSISAAALIMMYKDSKNYVKKVEQDDLKERWAKILQLAPRKTLGEIMQKAESPPPYDTKGNSPPAPQNTKTQGMTLSLEMVRYIEKLITKDVKKATLVISAVEANDEAGFKQALAKKRENYYGLYEPSKTTGTRLYEKDNSIIKLHP